MSPLGYERTFSRRKSTSALTPRPDIPEPMSAFRHITSGSPLRADIPVAVTDFRF